MTIRDITQYIETLAPLKYQESYDNAGLIVGNPSAACKKVLLCLDSTEDVIEEAIKLKCNLVIAHHPIVFKGLKKFTGRNYVERTIIKAIKNDIAIYAAHTNLDNVQIGVNQKICKKLKLKNCRILAPKKQLLKKLSVTCPLAQVDVIKHHLFEAGADYIPNNSSFDTLGTSIYNSSGILISEINVELVFPVHKERQILRTLMEVHPYEQVNYQIVSLDNVYPEIGSGMIGTLATPMAPTEFLLDLKKRMKTQCVRHTALPTKKVKTIAVCGGAGGFLLPQAIAQGADVFVTADYKYHEFFDADKRIVIADIGHYESEQFTVELFKEFLTKKFSNFAVVLSKINTNPVKYL